MPPHDWHERFEERMAAYRARRQRQADERATRAARRAAGVEARHARKLKRTAEEGDGP